MWVDDLGQLEYRAAWKLQEHAHEQVLAGGQEKLLLVEHPPVITLYRLRWYLDDLASAIRLFRNRHRDTPDARRWVHGLAPRLEQLPRWLDLLG